MVAHRSTAVVLNRSNPSSPEAPSASVVTNEGVTNAGRFRGRSPGMEDRHVCGLPVRTCDIGPSWVGRSRTLRVAAGERPPARRAREPGAVAVRRSESGSRRRFRLVPGGRDFNGDGITDLAIGAPWEDIGEHVNAGAVHGLSAAASRKRLAARIIRPATGAATRARTAARAESRGRSDLQPMPLLRRSSRRSNASRRPRRAWGFRLRGRRARGGDPAS